MALYGRLFLVATAAASLDAGHAEAGRGRGDVPDDRGVAGVEVGEKEDR